MSAIERRALLCLEEAKEDAQEEEEEDAQEEETEEEEESCTQHIHAHTPTQHGQMNLHPAVFRVCECDEVSSNLLSVQEHENVLQ